MLWNNRAEHTKSLHRVEKLMETDYKLVVSWSTIFFFFVMLFLTKYHLHLSSPLKPLRLIQNTVVLFRLQKSSKLILLEDWIVKCIFMNKNVVPWFLPVAIFSSNLQNDAFTRSFSTFTKVVTEDICGINQIYQS